MPLDASTQITIGGVQCWDEGTQESLGRAKSSAQRTLLCAWTDRVKLIAALRGGGSIVGAVSLFNAAQQYSPDFPFLYIDTVGTEGVGVLSQDGNGMVAYKYARLTAKYSTIDYIEGAETGTVSIDFANQILTLPRSQSMLKFTDGAMEDLPPENHPGLRNTIFTIEFVRRNLPQFPTTKIKAACDAPLNSDTVSLTLPTVNPFGLSGGGLGIPLGGLEDPNATDFSFEPGKVLFEGGKSFRRNTTTSAISYDIAYRMSYNPLGWDKFFDKTGALRQVVKQNGDPLYASSALMALLA